MKHKSLNNVSPENRGVGRATGREWRGQRRGVWRREKVASWWVVNGRVGERSGGEKGSRKNKTAVGRYTEM